MPPRNPDPEDTASQDGQPLTDAPRIVVLGELSGSFLVRASWNEERHTVSPSRLKFLSDIGMDVRNDPQDYVL